MKRSARSKRDWSRVRFGDVVLNSTAVSRDPEGEGFTRYIIGKHIDENRPRVESWGDVGDPDFGPRIRTIFLPGDIICTTRGPKLKVATVDFRGLGAHTNFVLRTRNPEVLLQPYLEAIVRSDAFQQHLAKHFRGSVNLFVNWSDAALYEFEMPPIEEQLDLLVTLTAASDATHASALALAASHNLFRAVADHYVGMASHAYASQPLVDHLDALTVGIVVKPAALYVPLTEDGVIALRSLNITPHKIVRDDIVHISREGHAAHSKSALRAGDVAVVRTGRPGDAAVIPDDLHDVNCIDLIIMRPRTSLNPHFLTLFLNSTAGRALFSSGATGTAQQHFNIGACRQLKLAVPPRSVQDRIVDATTAVWESTQAIQARLDATTRLKQHCVEVGTQP